MNNNKKKNHSTQIWGNLEENRRHLLQYFLFLLYTQCGPFKSISDTSCKELTTATKSFHADCSTFGKISDTWYRVLSTCRTNIHVKIQWKIALRGPFMFGSLLSVINSYAQKDYIPFEMVFFVSQCLAWLNEAHVFCKYINESENKINNNVYS